MHFYRSPPLRCPRGEGLRCVRSQSSNGVLPCSQRRDMTMKMQFPPQPDFVGLRKKIQFSDFFVWLFSVGGGHTFQL